MRYTVTFYKSMIYTVEAKNTIDAVHKAEAELLRDVDVSPKNFDYDRCEVCYDEEDQNVMY